LKQNESILKTIQMKRL